MMAVRKKVRKFREALGLSYEDLARRLRCETRLVQRAEAGLVTRLSFAMELAEILGKPVGDVFPALGQPLKSLSGGSYIDFRTDDLDQQFRDAGIDPDPQLHRFRFVLRNGLERYVELTSAESARLRINLWAPSATFVWFETATERIALNVKHILVWQFISEFAPVPVLGDDIDDPQLAIWAGTTKDAIRFDVEPDRMEFGTEEADAVAVLQMLFFQIEHCWEDDEVFHLNDDEGDTIFFRADNVSMLSVPLEAVSPALWDALNEQ